LWRGPNAFEVYATAALTIGEIDPKAGILLILSGREAKSEREIENCMQMKIEVKM